MPSHPIAYVDESWLQQRGSPGAYLMSAVLIEQDDVAVAIDAARAAAHDHDYHSSVLYHRGHVGIIEEMLDVVSEHAGWSVISVHTPLRHGSPEPPPETTPRIARFLERQGEHARQISLERLLRHLNTHRVRDVILESRASDDEWRLARNSGTRVPATDRSDVRAYRRLLDQRAISHRMRLVHVKDRTHPGLWMADAVAWSAGRALRSDEPQWWNRIVDVATILEATTGTELRLNERRAAPPDGEHDPHNLSQRAQAVSSPSVYNDPDQPTQAGNILTNLIAQAEQARMSTGEQLAREVLRQLRDIADRVDELSDTVGRITPQQRKDAPTPGSRSVDHPAPQRDEPDSPSISG
ncbi:hypothetical protein KBX50_28985 [Micromonospora sp. C51]|uniref:hypothetical protein n=1 Tax=Micromonospora sp. C51 TaxID=2824879 RepID=UPI001B369C0B|nr:hypothetical protein [Micromonospora sp. C51]MBQ1052473.1 hypothetical protein [Micromonospora sp. C51]